MMISLSVTSQDVHACFFAEAPAQNPKCIFVSYCQLDWLG